MPTEFEFGSSILVILREPHLGHFFMNVNIEGAGSTHTGPCRIKLDNIRPTVEPDMVAPQSLHWYFLISLKILLGANDHTLAIGFYNHTIKLTTTIAGAEFSNPFFHFISIIVINKDIHLIISPYTIDVQI